MNVLELYDLTREFTRRGKPFAAVDHVNLILLIFFSICVVSCLPLQMHDFYISCLKYMCINVRNRQCKNQKNQ